MRAEARAHIQMPETNPNPVSDLSEFWVTMETKIVKVLVFGVFLVLHQAFNDSKLTMPVLAAGGDAGAQIYVLQINSASPDQGAILIN